MRVLLVLALLLAASPTFPAESTLPSTRDEIASTLGSDEWYPGSKVADALWQLAVIARQEIERTAKEAVSVAVQPYQAENRRLRLELAVWKVVALVLGAAAVGAGGALVAGAVGK